MKLDNSGADSARLTQSQADPTMQASIHTQGITIPGEIIHGWQQTVDLIARIVRIPASLIMRIHTQEIEVFVSSDSPDNPYKANETETLGKGLYCETVISEQRELRVPNALKDPLWDHNPDLALNMISYCGLPLNWPNGDPFGTICILDHKENPYTPEQRKLLDCFRQAVEANLKTIYQKEELEFANQHLEQRVQERTSELVKLNKQLGREIDNRNAAEKMLYYQSHYNSLTGLPNRNQLSKTLSGYTDKHKTIAALHLGLSNFKEVNDNFGYAVGDRVLISIANRIRQLLPESVYIAHTEGDQFTLLLTDIPTGEPDYPADIANQLCHLFNTPVYTDGHSIPVSARIGIALSPQDTCDPTELLQKASVARNLAANQGGTRFQFFDQQLQEGLSQRIQIEAQLNQALVNDELEVYYQPFVDTVSGQITGAEALLRWNNATLGAVGPDHFIPVAERNGQIIELGLFVLREAISQMALWRKQSDTDLRIAINLSPLQFSDPELCEKITNLLDLYQLPPEALELEVTEGVLLQNESQARKILQQFVSRGIRISLDDFGTGYSSLSYLRKYPFHTVKVDRSFISGLAGSARDQELVRAIVAMAHKLKLEVIAEGIETIEQAEFIKAEGCETGQGYLFGRPQPASHFSHYLEAKV